MKLLILCPNCEDFCEVERKDNNIDIMNPCSCLEEGEKSPTEWIEMILKDWDSLTVMKEPNSLAS